MKSTSLFPKPCSINRNHFLIFFDITRRKRLYSLSSTSAAGLFWRKSGMEKLVLLARIKKAISGKIGQNRLEGVFLFGSEARSNALEDSDINILVLLKGPVHLGDDLQDVISATYSIQLEIDRCLHFIVADRKDFDSGEFSLYRTIKSEGVAA